MGLTTSLALSCFLLPHPHGCRITDNTRTKHSRYSTACQSTKPFDCVSTLTDAVAPTTDIVLQVPLQLPHACDVAGYFHEIHLALQLSRINIIQTFYSTYARMQSQISITQILYGPAKDAILRRIRSKIYLIDPVILDTVVLQLIQKSHHNKGIHVRCTPQGIHECCPPRNVAAVTARDALSTTGVKRVLYPPLGLCHRLNRPYKNRPY